MKNDNGIKNDTICKPATTCVTETPRARGTRHYRPDVDIVENAEGVTVFADMPGVAAGDVDVSYKDGTLSIRGRVQPRLEEDVAVVSREYGVGDFYRAFAVSKSIAADRIDAKLADGVLTLHLPKVDAVKPRRIEIKGA